MEFDKFNFRDELAEEVGRVFFHFVENFDVEKVFKSDIYGEANFLEQINLMHVTFSSTIYVNFEHIIQFSDELADIIEEQYFRIESYICEAVNEFVCKIRNEKNEKIQQSIQKFWVGFYNLPNLTPLKFLNSSKLNKLSCVSGLVTQISEPYPQLIYGSFSCENYGCNFIINYVEQSFGYSEPKICPKCHTSNTWTLIFEDSFFVEYQKIRVQETSNEIWTKTFPITIDVFLRNDFVDSVKPGDKCFFTGFLTTRSIKFRTGNLNEIADQSDQVINFDSKFFAHINDKTHFNTCFVVSHLFSTNFKFKRKFFDWNKRNKNMKGEVFFSRKEKKQILKIRTKKNLLKYLIQSFAPNLQHLDNVKIGILLLLVGGIKKKTIENINLRGHINICLLGNLNFDKNYLIKSVFDFFSRTIVVNGKTSTSAGLTASILRNYQTNDFSIQAGALMLSDKGVCFIEHINNLKFRNQLSIYEVMEHQTISVAKANIRTTVKARSSVFATIELPQKKYDKTKNVHKNSGLTFSIFSRFDLFFLVLDTIPKRWDLDFSQKLLKTYYDKKKSCSKNYFLRSIELYISFARLLKPIIKFDSGTLIIRIYKYMRKCHFLENFRANHFSIRQLESLIRLAEGFAKLYLCRYVKEFHVKAAGNLLFNSLYPLNKFAKIHFSNTFENFINDTFRKKKKNYDAVDLTRRIGFREFQILFKSIISEIQNLKHLGFQGTSVKLIFKRITKIQCFNFSMHQKTFQVKKMFLIMKYMIFSLQNLFIIKSAKQTYAGKKIRRLVFLKEIAHRTGFEPARETP